MADLAASATWVDKSPAARIVASGALPIMVVSRPLMTQLTVSIAAVVKVYFRPTAGVMAGGTLPVIVNSRPVMTRLAVAVGRVDKRPAASTVAAGALPVEMDSRPVVAQLAVGVAGVIDFDRSQPSHQCIAVAKGRKVQAAFG